MTKESSVKLCTVLFQVIWAQRGLIKTNPSDDVWPQVKWLPRAFSKARQVRLWPNSRTKGIGLGQWVRLGTKHLNLVFFVCDHLSDALKYCHVFRETVASCSRRRPKSSDLHQGAWGLTRQGGQSDMTPWSPWETGGANMISCCTTLLLGDTYFLSVYQT